MKIDISQAARDALADRYNAHQLDRIGHWVRSGGGDISTHTPALEALTIAFGLALVPKPIAPCAFGHVYFSPDGSPPLFCRECGEPKP